jgi:hypothetical protein
MSEVSQAFESLIEAGREAFKWFGSLTAFTEEMKEMGFPSFSLSGTHAPCDYLGNYLRGTRGIMLDLYRNPEKLIKACERLVPWMIQ